jgi:hypothetical protein
MEFGIRLLLLLAAAIVFLIAIFSDLHQGDLIAVGLLLVSLALIVVDTPLSRMKWSTTSMGGPRRQ